MEFYRSQGTKYHGDAKQKGFYGGGMPSQPENQARELFKYYLSLNKDNVDKSLFNKGLITLRAKEFWDDLFKTTESPLMVSEQYYNEHFKEYRTRKVPSKTDKAINHSVRDLSSKILYFGRHCREHCPFVSTGMDPDVKVATSSSDTLYKISMELGLYAILDNGVLSKLSDETAAPKGCKCILAMDTPELDFANHIAYIHAFTGTNFKTGEATFFTKIPPDKIQYRVKDPLKDVWEWKNII